MAGFAFFLFMVIMFFTGIICVIAGLGIFLFKKKKNIMSGGAIIVVIIGIAFSLIPTGWLMMIRSANGQLEEDYIDTGIMLHWENREEDRFTFQGKTYEPVYYSEEIFYYDIVFGEDGKAAANIETRPSFWNVFFNDQEKGTIYYVETGVGELLCYEGQLYSPVEKLDEAAAYYMDDSHYSWYIEIDDEETEHRYPIMVTDEEMEEIDAMDELKKEKSYFFEEASQMGTLIKVSGDGLVSGRLSVGCFEGQWYWRTEIADESNEKDDWWAEYVQPLPETLNKKIQDCI